LLFFSCSESRKKNTHQITEGEIVYEVVNNQEFDTNNMSFIYPKEMILLFKDNKLKLSLNGPLGAYTFDFIYNDTNDTVFTLLKIPLLFDKKVFTTTINKKLLFFAELISNQNTVFYEETKEIAGIKAHKAKLIFNENTKPDITVWYSNDFSLNSPNRNTLFENIPGILLEFEIKIKDVTFNFKANKINIKNITDDFFYVPNDFTLISIQEMEELLSTVF